MSGFLGYGFKAHLSRDPVRDMVDVWLVRGDQLVTFLGNDVALAEISPRERPAPSFSLPHDAFESLIAAGVGVVAPTPATTRHLDDAIAVRDRLLALVEKNVGPE